MTSSFALLPGLVLVLIIVAIILFIRVMRQQGDSGTAREEEAQLIQDLYHGLQRMEERIEALETLLLDRERSESAAHKK